MASKADEFRKNADYSRQRAENAANSFDREYWLKMLDHWLKMAAAEDAADRTDQH